MSEALAVQGDISFAEDIRTWRQQILRTVLRALSILATVAIVPGAYSAYKTQDTWLIPLYLVVYGSLLVVTFWRRVPYEAQVWALLTIIYGMSVIELMDGGLSGEGRTYLVTVPLIAAIFLGRRQSTIVMILATLTLSAFGWGYSTSRLVPSVEIQDVTTDWTWWLNSVISLIMLGVMLTISLNVLMPRLAGALTRSRKLAQELEAHQATLEEQVAQRTTELARKSAQLEAAAQVAREAAAIQDVGTLIEKTVHLISNYFGYYHAGIFLLDESGTNAVLRAASSEGGQRMLARGHRLRVGAEGIVGFVTGQGRPRIALDVGEDAIFFDNPDLPDTRSEMALPLRVRSPGIGTIPIIGALDVQSTEPAAFSEEDIAVLQTLADQVALAISNTRFFQQAQESLEAERRAYGLLSREAWRKLSRARPDLHERYDPQGILSSYRGDSRDSQDSHWRGEMKQAQETDPIVLGEVPQSATLTAPIKVRDQVIGVLDAYKPEGTDAWDPEEIALLETLTEQLGIALESARLYQDSQRRAVRERLIGEVTDRLRATLNVDTVLRTAVRELRETLGLAEAEVRIGPGSESK